MRIINKANQLYLSMNLVLIILPHLKFSLYFFQVEKVKENSLENVQKDTTSPRETRRSRTSASSVTNKEEKSSLRETRTRGALKSEDSATAPPRESRARTSGPTEVTETASGGVKENRGSRSISLPISQVCSIENIFFVKV